MTGLQLKEIIPAITDINLRVYLPLLNNAFEKYLINSKERKCNFIAQVAHESNSFNTLVENLNYSAKGLRTTFPKYFPNDVIANQYAGKPQKIANYVYAGRLGNGSVESGDGWKYCGHGLIQITGKDNHRECSEFLFGDQTLVENPDLLLVPENAIDSSCWFWVKHKLNGICDLPDNWSKKWNGKDYDKFQWLTIKINGSLNGLADRLTFYEKAKKELT